MKLSNKKGYFLSPIPVVAGFLGTWIALGAVCVWHIPAWNAAKKAHCESAYQAGDMGCGYRK